MFRTVQRRVLAGTWGEILVATAGAAALSAAAMAVGVHGLWFAAGIVPPAVMLLVWRGAPPPTIGEILYVVDRRD